MSEGPGKEIQSLLERAEDSLRAVQLMHREKLYDICASRAYYAAFFGAEQLSFPKIAMQPASS